MIPISVRTANDSDRLPVFNLAQELATSFSVQRECFDDSFSQLLLADDAQLLVAAQGELVIGYCLAFDHRAFFANGRVTWVEEIVVSEETRRSGAGRMLMKEIERWADTRGSKIVALATRRAAEFYKAIGYEDSAVYFRKIVGEV